MSLYVIMETQKGNVALGLVLLIVALIFIFVGLPYLVRMLKSDQLLPYRSPSAYVTETAPSLAVQNDWRSQSHYNDSAYKGRVIIVGIGQIGRQSLNLSAMPNPNGLVNINGWKITTSRFNDFVIGSLREISRRETIKLKYGRDKARLPRTFALINAWG